MINIKINNIKTDINIIDVAKINSFLNFLKCHINDATVLYKEFEKDKDITKAKKYYRVAVELEETYKIFIDIYTDEFKLFINFKINMILAELIPIEEKMKKIREELKWILLTDNFRDKLKKKNENTLVYIVNTDYVRVETVFENVSRETMKKFNLM